MKVRMLSDNCDCWKKGDVFEVYEMSGWCQVICNSVKDGGTHWLLDKDCKNFPIKELHNCPDLEVLEQDQ